MHLKLIENPKMYPLNVNDDNSEQKYVVADLIAVYGQKQFTSGICKQDMFSSQIHSHFIVSVDLQ